MVPVSEKRDFIRWFLHHYELQQREAAFLLTYLIYNEPLLAKVHFVEQVPSINRSIIISATGVEQPAFRFLKNKRIGHDVESAYFDMKTFPSEDVYMGLYYKDRSACPRFAAVMEGIPMKKQDIVQDQMLSLFAEMVLDESLRRFQEAQLRKQIDEALAQYDQKRFEELVIQLEQLRNDS
jgi:uncharacterized protein YpiB (UPF0302 family)